MEQVTTAQPHAITFAALPSHKRFAAGFRDGVNGMEPRHTSDGDYSRGYYLGELTWEEDSQAAKAKEGEAV